MVKIKNMIIYFNIFIELRLKRKYHRSVFLNILLEREFSKICRDQTNI